MAGENKKRAHVLVFGIVQGVGFRASAQRKARELGLTGFVRNLEDGSVEIMAEGDERKLSEFLEWAKKGPPGAHVEKIEIKFLNPEGKFKTFEIKY